MFSDASSATTVSEFESSFPDSTLAMIAPLDRKASMRAIASVDVARTATSTRRVPFGKASFSMVSVPLKADVTIGVATWYG